MCSVWCLPEKDRIGYDKSSVSIFVDGGAPSGTGCQSQKVILAEKKAPGRSDVSYRVVPHLERSELV